MAVTITPSRTCLPPSRPPAPLRALTHQSHVLQLPGALRRALSLEVGQENLGIHLGLQALYSLLLGLLHGKRALLAVVALVEQSPARGLCTRSAVVRDRTRGMTREALRWAIPAPHRSVVSTPAK